MRVDAEPAKSPSFWIARTLIEQSAPDGRLLAAGAEPERDQGADRRNGGLHDRLRDVPDGVGRGALRSAITERKRSKPALANSLQGRNSIYSGMIHEAVFFAERLVAKPAMSSSETPAAQSGHS